MGDAAATHVRVRVPGKVNLFLGVRGVRGDGYHDIVSVLQTVSIHDTILARLDGKAVSAHPAARRFMELTFTVDGVVDGSIPVNGDNLAVRAARALMEESGVGTAPHTDDQDVPITRLHLTKRIPVAAGMAGGSADAAGTLLALNHLWESELDRRELRALAGPLGADVPFCIMGGTALATGTGTSTAQVLTRGVYHWVVGITDRPLSTPQVYRTFDEVSGPSDIEPDAVLQALRTGDAEALGAALHNDLEVAAVHLLPDLAERRQAMFDAGALGAMVSGSGPTLVALAATAQEANAMAERLVSDFDRVEVAISPAGGPELAQR